MIKGGMDTKGMIKEANSILHQKHGAGDRKTPMERRIFVPDACGGGLFPEMGQSFFGMGRGEGMAEIPLHD